MSALAVSFPQSIGHGGLGSPNGTLFSKLLTQRLLSPSVNEEVRAVALNQKEPFPLGLLVGSY